MTEAYQVLARKWRPQLFSELAGLEHITRTLKNAIRLNRIGHAFLFTGSRGVGKTSAARILAKALNCRTGPVEEPCNSCENCVAITAGSAADVIEIDGASNRGIDEIRLLRENVTYLPQNSPYKIYIIDEVHMLTTEAFNALLKTLEEPPDHVKFIMATTDVHKMPMTILSRCQRFDFGRLTQAVIAATLVEIGVREKIEFGSGTTELLAREAQGSMRDALSLLDQVRSYAGETILVADLRQALGLIESRHCFSLLENVVRGELGSAVSQINDLEQSGVDLKRFSEEFLFYLRDALFMKLSSKLDKLLGISKDEAALLAPLVGDCTLPYWQQIFDLWQQHFTQIKTSQTPRLALEMALIELGMARDLTPVTELMGRIDQYLKAGPETPFKAPPSRKTEKPAPVDTSAAKPVSSSPQPKPQPESQPRSAAPAAATVQSPPQVAAQPVAAQPAPVQKPQSQPEVSSAPPEMPPAPPAMDETSLGGSVCEAPMPFLEESGSGLVQDVTPAPAPAPAPEITGKVVAAKNNSVAPGDIEGWAGFVARLTGRDARLGSMLQRSQPQLTASGTLSLAVTAHVLAVLDNENTKTDILALWARFRDADNISKIELRSLGAVPGPQSVNNKDLSSSADGTTKHRSLPGKEEIFNDPSVRFISDRFGGRVTDIRTN